jgi:hypothetical protein
VDFSPARFVEDFQQVSAALGGGRSEPPVVQRDEIGFGDLLEECDIAAVSVHDAQLSRSLPYRRRLDGSLIVFRSVVEPLAEHRAMMTTEPQLVL